MALSEHEQRLLKEIEQSLLAEDPKFGSVAVDHDDTTPTAAFSLRGIAVMVIGLIFLVGGVALSQTSLWLVVLSIIGFLIMVAGGLWMLRGGGAPRRRGGGSSGMSSRAKPKNKGGLGNRMEDNFRRRFEN